MTVKAYVMAKAQRKGGLYFERLASHSTVQPYQFVGSEAKEERACVWVVRPGSYPSSLGIEIAILYVLFPGSEIKKSSG